MGNTIQQGQTSTEPKPAVAVAVDHKVIITLVIAYLVNLPLFAGREFKGATRLAGHLLQDNDQLAGAIVQALRSDGYLDPDWLDSSHPRIRSNNRQFSPGSHRGINPTARGPTWGFQRELVPKEAWK